MLRRAVITAAAITATGLLATGCSSNTPKPAAAAATSTALAGGTSTPTSTAPNSAECGAVTQVVTQMMPQLESTTDVGSLQDPAGVQYYQELVEAIENNGGTDTASAPVLADAEQLESAYTALNAAATSGAGALDPNLSTDLQAISTDLGQMATDQAQFDQDCGIPTIVPS
jgi:hypothetical protein